MRSTEEQLVCPFHADSNGNFTPCREEICALWTFSHTNGVEDIFMCALKKIAENTKKIY